MDGRERFDELMAEWEVRPGVTRSTMMGFPCLRVNGDFFACANRQGTFLIVKLAESRVLEAIDDGEAVPFAPNGRTFKQWAAVPTERADEWPKWLDEAHAFVGGGTR